MISLLGRIERENSGELERSTVIGFSLQCSWPAC